ncbi:zinc knuckle [Paraphaeosphaeria sporulosa]
MQALRVGPAMVPPAESAKILGVVFDSALSFKEHVARAAKRGWQGAQALSRLRGVRPATARQLFGATFTASIGYAAAAWFPQYLEKEIPAWMRHILGPIQRLGAKAVTNCFRSVSEEAGCAEAYLPSTSCRLKRRIAKFWVDAHTLPKSSLLWKPLKRAIRAGHKTQYKSPTMYMAMSFRPSMETINGFAIPPWGRLHKQRIGLHTDREKAKNRCIDMQGREVQMFTDASMKNNKVGYGVVIWEDGRAASQERRTIGTTDMMNVYIVELAAIKEVVGWARAI